MSMYAGRSRGLGRRLAAWANVALVLLLAWAAGARSWRAWAGPTAPAPPGVSRVWWHYPELRLEVPDRAVGRLPAVGSGVYVQMPAAGAAPPRLRQVGEVACHSAGADGSRQIVVALDPGEGAILREQHRVTWFRPTELGEFLGVVLSEPRMQHMRIDLQILGAKRGREALGPVAELLGEAARSALENLDRDPEFAGRGFVRENASRLATSLIDPGRGSADEKAWEAAGRFAEQVAAKLQEPEMSQRVGESLAEAWGRLKSAEDTGPDGTTRDVGLLGIARRYLLYEDEPGSTIRFSPEVALLLRALVLKRGAGGGAGELQWLVLEPTGRALEPTELGAPWKVESAAGLRP